MGILSGESRVFRRFEEGSDTFTMAAESLTVTRPLTAEERAALAAPPPVVEEEPEGEGGEEGEGEAAPEEPEPPAPPPWITTLAVTETTDPANPARQVFESAPYPVPANVAGPLDLVWAFTLGADEFAQTILRREKYFVFWSDVPAEVYELLGVPPSAALDARIDRAAASLTPQILSGQKIVALELPGDSCRRRMGSAYHEIPEADRRFFDEALAWLIALSLYSAAQQQALSEGAGAVKSVTDPSGTRIEYAIPAKIAGAEVWSQRGYDALKLAPSVQDCNAAPAKELRPLYARVLTRQPGRCRFFD